MGRMDFTDVVIPDNVTEINTRAFKNCTALTSVVIPPSVTLVGEQAFYDCSALVSVLCRPTSAPTLVADAFTGCHASLQICVPKLGGTDGYNSSDWNTSYGEKLNLCFLDERDDEETTAGQISTFRTDLSNAIYTRCLSLPYASQGRVFQYPHASVQCAEYRHFPARGSRGV